MKTENKNISKFNDILKYKKEIIYINNTEVPLVLTCHNTFHVEEIWRRGLGTVCSLDRIHVFHHPESEKMQPFQWPPETPG